MTLFLALFAAAGTPAATLEIPPAAPIAVFADAAPLDTAALDQATARADIAQQSRADQVARVSNSSVNGTSRTGEVTIRDNAFQNLSGLAVINSNSGNNVAINAALNVNVIITRAD